MSIEIDRDQDRLDVGLIHKYLVEESYWARERTGEQTRTASEKWIWFGVYKGERQIAFARVVSNRATCAYIGDVFVIDEFRGRGIGKMLMEAMVSHPGLQGLRRWVLATRDAHRLYKDFDFTALKHPERWMERAAPNA